jgi:hypothetical protein
MYINAARRITSAKALKQRKRFGIAGGEGPSPGGSAQFTPTTPARSISYI